MNNNNLLWKGGLVVVILIICLVTLWPNVTWYSLPLAERTKQARLNNPVAKKVIPLGLDLQGGVHLVYQVDTTKLTDLSDAAVKRAIDQNIVVINNRIDALGVANANISQQGREFIVVDLPGVYESEAAKKIIGKTALLEFRIVKNDEALVKILQELDKAGLHADDVANGNIPEDIKKLIPAGMELMPEREGGFLLVEDKAALTGNYLKESRVQTGGNGMSIGGVAIDFELDPKGAQLFGALTASHINDRLAIVLDRVIQSAPNIQSPIPSGRGQITGSFTDEQAKLLSNILNSGNLQAPMSVVEERTIGPELGEDSIKDGLKGSIIGFALVIGFMLFYYKFSGFLADLALILNLLILLASMAWINATLTLPGIAGIILSLAMAVDANVLILERVREELARGKQVKTAVDEGYAKAVGAIIDGNVTTILTGLFLFQLGTGAVKGFGITLILGLMISVFTAVFVTKVCYEIWFAMARPKTLSV